MMNLLLDSHVLLWWLNGDSRLGTAAQSAISRTPMVFVSAVTAWELSVKQRLGKLTLDFDLREELTAEAFRPLSITAEHGLVAGGLELIHRDPFDRMLVAQAQCEGMTLVSADPWVAKYDVPVLPAS